MQRNKKAEERRVLVTDYTSTDDTYNKAKGEYKKETELKLKDILKKITEIDKTIEVIKFKDDFNNIIVAKVLQTEIYYLTVVLPESTKYHTSKLKVHYSNIIEL